MIFTETKLAGLWLINPEPIADERGLFARTFCAAEFAEHGLCTEFSQCNTSFNLNTHTLRGMHFQRDPHGEIKTVSCTRGAIFDVAVDVRENSATFSQWFGTVLSQENRATLYIPEGFAHGFLTLEPNSEVAYRMSTPYVPASADGVRYNDPCFAIDWPAVPAVISEKDQQYPDFRTENGR